MLGLAYLVHSYYTVFQDPADISRLEFASPYIGLKELYASGRVNSSRIDPILVRPRFSAQVFPEDAYRLAPLGERDRWENDFGRISPHERRLHVTPETHTIVQLRAIDFGMEDCELTVTLPAPADALESGAFFDMTAGSRFDVFRLGVDHKSPIDVKKLSFRSKPGVLEQVANGLVLVPGKDTVVHRFPCPSASVHAFEFACPRGSDCRLDAWSSQNTTFGVNMYQYQTI
ncbi:uncharacterized protein BXZ73DRAFT_100872 [Epithele typhae]|uniref:uncharacterized protein n=1 Tax=Epithele typhae TaxID=378194 RepID=UPI002007A7B4|nr:uncharacterized protein BXZ73DRAFT_100872 [Epithele typhae]KAH9934033.1 hypothetical protein BXZ73DRAFT_100872 [Epithele typhae]